MSLERATDELISAKNKLIDHYTKYGIIKSQKDLVMELPVNIDSIITIYNEKKKRGDIESLGDHTDLTECTPDYVYDTVKKFTARLPFIFTNETDYVKKNISKVKYEIYSNAVYLLTLYIENRFHPMKVIKEYKFNCGDLLNVLDIIYNRVRNAVITPGEMVGANASQAIAEPATQACVDGSELTIIYNKTRNKVSVVPIGDFIDEMIESRPYEVKSIDNSSSLILSLERDSVYTITYDHTYKQFKFKRLDAVVRHKLARNKLLKVTTKKYKRQIRVTPNKSIIGKRIDNGELECVDISNISDVSTTKFNDKYRIPVMIGIPRLLKSPIKTVKIMLYNEEFPLNYQIGCLIGSFLRNGGNFTAKLNRYEIDTIRKTTMFKRDIDYTINNRIMTVKSNRMKSFIETYCDELSENFVINTYLSFTDSLMKAYLRDRFVRGMVSSNNIITIKKKNDEKETKLIKLYYLRHGINLVERDGILTGEIIRSIISDTVDYDEIESIEEVESTRECVYDFSINETQTFINLDGFATHNTLNAIHYSAFGTKNVVVKNLPYLKRLLALTKDLGNAEMTIQLHPSDKSNYMKANEIANKIKYTIIDEFIVETTFEYDPYPISDSRNKNDKPFIDDFVEFNSSMIINEERLAKYVIRMVVSKKYLHTKQVRLSEIINTIRRKIDGIFIIHSSENAEEIIMRVHFKDSEFMKYYKRINNVTELLKTYDRDIRNLHLRGIKNVSEVNIAVEKTKDEKTGKILESYVIKTKGSNLRQVFYERDIDVYNTTTTDPVEVYEVFGSVAMFKVLNREIMDTVRSSGNKIAWRHIYQLTGYMTNDTKPIKFDRTGLRDSKRGPLTEISFEEQIKNIKRVSLYTESDNFCNPSSRTMFSQINYAGSNSFDVGYAPIRKK